MADDHAGGRGYMRILDLLYPEKCVFCGSLVYGGERVCLDCSRHLPYLTEPVCRQCGKPIEDERVTLCSDCERRGISFIDETASLWIYEDPVKSALMDFKYGGCTSDADFYAKELVDRYARRIRAWSPDALVPVPIHRRRQWFRGYNQATELAFHIGRRLGIPVTELLIRDRYTAPQKSLSPSERRANLRDAFSVDMDMEPDRYDSVLLIDDIYTTGATLESCAEHLKDAGVQRVYGMCLCAGSGS